MRRCWKCPWLLWAFAPARPLAEHADGDPLFRACGVFWGSWPGTDSITTSWLCNTQLIHVARYISPKLDRALNPSTSCKLQQPRPTSPNQGLGGNGIQLASFQHQWRSTPSTGLLAELVLKMTWKRMVSCRTFLGPHHYPNPQTQNKKRGS